MRGRVVFGNGRRSCKKGKAELKERATRSPIKASKMVRKGLQMVGYNAGLKIGVIPFILGLKIRNTKQAATWKGRL